ncbi:MULTISPECIES: hypothetical protein [Wohlfahrtiimonas]|uniref:phage tail assembly chaperone n=1 Tax=Wohlfahrtiimonas TaxID=582472 RepID=UPI000B98CF83|nr:MULTISPECIES: hypothetical protein [Wohlfahrtiimonas]MBS7818817.1 hypothetical protein [Wohlfahrtiimonas chitiniclastica]OYQ75492.1 hypothetical protein B9T20_01980 [Wohlfahrtiimonas sp. G9077]
MSENLGELEELKQAPLITQYYQHVWDWFLSLNQTRNTVMGRTPISYTEIAAFSSLMSIEMDRDDVEALRLIDSIYLDEMRDI